MILHIWKDQEKKLASWLYKVLSLERWKVEERGQGSLNSQDSSLKVPLDPQLMAPHGPSFNIHCHMVPNESHQRMVHVNSKGRHNGFPYSVRQMGSFSSLFHMLVSMYVITSLLWIRQVTHTPFLCFLHLISEFKSFSILWLCSPSSLSAYAHQIYLTQ